MPVGRLTNAGWLDGILGCLKPMWMIIGKNKPNEVEKGENNKSIKKSSSLIQLYIYMFATAGHGYPGGDIG